MTSQDILKQKTESIEVKNYAVEYMKSQDSFTYTKKVAEQYKTSTIQKITELGGNEELVKLIEELWTTMP